MEGDPRLCELSAHECQRKLPKQDRALLRTELDDLDEPAPQEEINAAWDEEIARRLQTVKDGTAVLHDHEDVMRELDEIAKH